MQAVKAYSKYGSPNRTPIEWHGVGRSEWRGGFKENVVEFSAFAIPLHWIHGRSGAHELRQNVGICHENERFNSDCMSLDHKVSKL